MLGHGGLDGMLGPVGACMHRAGSRADARLGAVHGSGSACTRQRVLLAANAKGHARKKRHGIGM